MSEKQPTDPGQDQDNLTEFYTDRHLGNHLLAEAEIRARKLVPKMDEPERQSRDLRPVEDYGTIIDKAA